MPILSYFAVVGSALVALLFVADATLAKRDTPVIATSNMYGLPKPWKPDPTQTLAARTAPEPDMGSAAVLAAAPKPEPVAATVAKPDAKPEPPKKKQAARKPQRGPQDWRQQGPHDWRNSYAWSRNEGGFNGGGGGFGRF
jgi:hypothetical protein